MGASGKPDRATRASTEPQERLGHTASVPCAMMVCHSLSCQGIALAECDTSLRIFRRLNSITSDVLMRGDPAVERAFAEGWLAGHHYKGGAKLAQMHDDWTAYAIATEAGTAATVEQGAVHEGAGPQDIAQTPPESNQ